jgi:predicted transcriptional regulator
MKNITFSADEDLIEKARNIARSRRKTLNIAFREWLEQFTAESGNVSEYRSLMRRLQHVDAGRQFTRDEMNER